MLRAVVLIWAGMEGVLCAKWFTAQRDAWNHLPPYPTPKHICLIDAAHISIVTKAGCWAATDTTSQLLLDTTGADEPAAILPPYWITWHLLSSPFPESRSFSSGGRRRIEPSARRAPGRTPARSDTALFAPVDAVRRRIDHTVCGIGQEVIYKVVNDSCLPFVLLQQPPDGLCRPLAQWCGIDTCLKLSYQGKNFLFLAHITTPQNGGRGGTPAPPVSVFNFSLFYIESSASSTSPMDWKYLSALNLTVEDIPVALASRN